MARRTILLLGQPLYNEDGAAGEVIRPGHLVDGVTTIMKHASAAGACPLAIAMERDELGKGIDDTPVTNSGSAAYAVGDTVKVGVFKPGDRAMVFVASGQNLTANDRLESAGDGSFRKYSAGVILARVLETTGAVTSLTRVRAEFM